MFGKKVWNRPLRRLRTLRILLIGGMLGLAIVLLIAFAIYDIVAVASKQDKSAHDAVLNAELAGFLLATRTDDGESLFDQTLQSSPSSRPLSATVVRKPFFEYLLRENNARYITSQKVDWNAPQACITEFPAQAPMITGAAFGLQTCFAALENDPSGRFLYFSLKYPTTAIRRHKRGVSPTDADFIRLDFGGRHPRGLYLVYETPVLAEKRYPSQIGRFAGLHEVTAYNLDGGLMRLVNAQAFEKLGDNGISYVTVLGRLDATDLVSDGSSAWPSAGIAGLPIALTIAHSPTADSPPSTMLELKPGVAGKALVSVQQAYVENVKSKGRLEVRLRGHDIWDSASIASLEKVNEPNLIQRISNWWTTTLLSTFRVSEVRTGIAQQRVGRDGALVATLTSSPYPLPDVVSRAFLWLTVGSTLILFLTGYSFYSIGRLRRVARTAWAMLDDPRRTNELRRFRSNRDEVGNLARIIFVLARKFHSLGRRRAYEQYHLLKADEERLKGRQAALEAIGHEIKSPLQSLLTMQFDNPAVQVKLARMTRAVEAIYQAASVESGLSSGQVVITQADLSAHLSGYVEALRETGVDVAYQGTHSGVFANFDWINLEQVLDHVIDNARRLKFEDSTIEITLVKHENSVLISIFNHGSEIKGDPEKIFQYGASQSTAPENLGLGLFASRSIVGAMKGSISAKNERDGVTVSIELPGVVPSLGGS